MLLSETFVWGPQEEVVLLSLSMKLTPECIAFSFSFAGCGSLGSRMDMVPATKASTTAPLLVGTVKGTGSFSGCTDLEMQKGRGISELMNLPC